MMQEAIATMNKNMASQFANFERQFDQRNRQFTSEKKGKGRATEGDSGLSKKRQSVSDRPSLADAGPSSSRPPVKRHRQDLTVGVKGNGRMVVQVPNPRVRVMAMRMQNL